jgi:Cytochrome C oxidase subunit II, transmembrane domain
MAARPRRPTCERPRRCGDEYLRAPVSTPAQSIFDLSMFVLGITGLIFVVVAMLLGYAIVKFRATPASAEREPAQVYGSTQIELAWIIIPALIVVVSYGSSCWRAHRAISSGSRSGPSVAILPAAIALVQEPLVVALQLVVQDHAIHSAPLLTEALLGAYVGPIDLRVVRQLARLSETGVERLAGIPRALLGLVPIRFEQVSATIGEDDSAVVRAEWRRVQQALSFDMPLGCSWRERL